MSESYYQIKIKQTKVAHNTKKCFFFKLLLNIKLSKSELLKTSWIKFNVKKIILFKEILGYIE